MHQLGLRGASVNLRHLTQQLTERMSVHLKKMAAEKKVVSMHGPDVHRLLYPSNYNTLYVLFNQGPYCAGHRSIE